MIIFCHSASDSDCSSIHEQVQLTPLYHGMILLQLVMTPSASVALTGLSPLQTHMPSAVHSSLSEPKGQQIRCTAVLF